MILVVDSGSYKSDWMFHSGEQDVLVRAKGINPFFTSERDAIRIVQKIEELKSFHNQIDEIYFFGSGCTNPDRREIMSNALSHVFPNAFISVDTDVIGSAYATCGDKEGFIATIGTGSNVSFFDGESVQLGKQGLGYVLGDIGSGAWFGINLITSFLYESMPNDLRVLFKQKYDLTKEKVIENVYQKQNPNVYLASFAPFLSENRQHSFIADLINQGFDELIRFNCTVYPDYTKYVCHFVGSIAYHFKKELTTVCAKHKVQMGKVIKQPIEDLYHYVLEQLKFENSII